MLSNKLPYLSRRKWRSNTDNIQEVLDRMVQFEDLVQFVEKEARIINNSVYGHIADKSTSSGKKPQPQRRVNMATNASEDQKNNESSNNEGAKMQERIQNGVSHVKTSHMTRKTVETPENAI